MGIESGPFSASHMYSPPSVTITSSITRELLVISSPLLPVTCWVCMDILELGTMILIPSLDLFTHEIVAGGVAVQKRERLFSSSRSVVPVIITSLLTAISNYCTVNYDL